MSNVFFPTVDGLGKPIHFKVESREAQFQTDIQRGMGGSEFRLARWSAPRWKWTISLPILPDTATGDSLRTLIGFFMARQGSFDSFLWTPREDAPLPAAGAALVGTNTNLLTGIRIGTGDGIQTVFPLVRPYSGAYPWGAFAEPVPWVDTRLAQPVAKVNGTTVTVAEILTDGATGGQCLRLAAAPASGTAVTADFRMAYRVRFGKDSATFKTWAYQLWKSGTFELEQCFE
jgi:uncharacterized protein (TIGR02217 family)